ncbi:MAG: hypothetical protein ACHQU0_00170 [Candidatus Paceibacteria bacterium]
MAKYLLILDITVWTDNSARHTVSKECEIECEPEQIKNKIQDQKRIVENDLRSYAIEVDLSEFESTIVVKQILPL